MKEGLILLITGAAADRCFNDADVMSSVAHHVLGNIDRIMALLASLMPTLV